MWAGFIGTVLKTTLNVDFSFRLYVENQHLNFCKNIPDVVNKALDHIQHEFWDDFVIERNLNDWATELTIYVYSVISYTSINWQLICFCYLEFGLICAKKSFKRALNCYICENEIKK